jgi:hypothetical protein
LAADQPLALAPVRRADEWADSVGGTPRHHGQIEDMILVPAKTWHVFGPIPVIVNK